MPRGIRDPLNGLRMMAQMLVDGHIGNEPQLWVCSRAAALKSRSCVIWIRLPPGFAIHANERKPGETVVRAHLCVIEAVLTVAPSSEDQFRIRVGINDEVSPAGRHDNFVTSAGLHGHADTGIISGFLLAINNRAALPDFEQLRSRPSAMGGDRMNMSLAAHGFLAKASFGIHHYAEEQHSPLEVVEVFL